MEPSLACTRETDCGIRARTRVLNHVPFSTALLDAYYRSWMAVVEYWLNIFLLGAVNTVAVEYAARAELGSLVSSPLS